jgi:parvulin-like peptidyl-prolyl isomerase
LAEEILEKIKGGATFEEMAAVYSQDSRRAQGGSWDWERTAVLRQEFKDAAAALQPGQTSAVIDAPEACYIMQLEDRKAAHVRPLNEVRQEIEDILLRAERQRLQDQWIERLKKKTFVRYF